jgi:uncharacterized membrane protein
VAAALYAASGLASLEALGVLRPYIFAAILSARMPAMVAAKALSGKKGVSRGQLQAMVLTLGVVGLLVTQDLPLPSTATAAQGAAAAAQLRAEFRGRLLALAAAVLSALAGVAIESCPLQGDTAWAQQGALSAFAATAVMAYMWVAGADGAQEGLTLSISRPEALLAAHMAAHGLLASGVQRLGGLNCRLALADLAVPACMALEGLAFGEWASPRDALLVAMLLHGSSAWLSPPAAEGADAGGAAPPLAMSDERPTKAAQVAGGLSPSYFRRAAVVVGAAVAYMCLSSYVSMLSTARTTGIQLPPESFMLRVCVCVWVCVLRVALGISMT